jgi:hypothetical protein
MRSFLVRGTAALGLLAYFWMPVHAARQAPGDGWVMSPSPPRMVKVLYWELAKQTEVWLRITPRSKDGAEIPANLVFSAVFQGDVTRPGAISTPPDQITLLAQASPIAYYVTPTLALSGDGGHALKLSPTNGHVLYGASCKTCGSTSLRVEMTAKSLTAVAQSAEVSGNVLGMTCHLERDDLDAIRKFARYIDVLK